MNFKKIDAVSKAVHHELYNMGYQQATANLYLWVLLNEPAVKKFLKQECDFHEIDSLRNMLSQHFFLAERHFNFVASPRITPELFKDRKTFVKSVINDVTVANALNLTRVTADIRHTDPTPLDLFKAFFSYHKEFPLPRVITDTGLADMISTKIAFKKQPRPPLGEMMPT